MLDTYHGLSRFILGRGLWLCFLMECAALALLWRSAQGGAAAARLAEYAGQFLFSAQVAYACALFGSLLAEDMTRYYERR